MRGCLGIIRPTGKAWPVTGSLRPLPRLSLALAVLLSIASPVRAQAPAAATYNDRFDELTHLADAPAGVARVKHLVIRRDAAEITLEDGALYRLGPIGGRTVAVAFKGSGSFSYAPSSKLEQGRLDKIYSGSALAAPLSAAVFLFADSTLAEIGRAVSFAPPAELPGDVKGRVREMIEFMSDPDSKAPDPDVMSDLLNSRSSDLFYAHVVRSDGDPVMFMLDPYALEGSILLGRARRAGWTRMTQLMSASRRQGDTMPTTRERRGQADITHYALDVHMPRANAGDVHFSAAARIDITAGVPAGPWVAFALYPKIVVDSARWADGKPAVVTKLKDASEMWLRLNAPIKSGDTVSATIYYHDHGEMIDRYGDLIYIKAASYWYPLSLEGRSYATFDLTYHTPPSYLFASVGDRVDSTVDADHLVQTHWVTTGPIRNAAFNLGAFESYVAHADSVPPVAVLYSEQAHRSGLLPRAYAKEQVGQDALNALKFFEHVYGPVPVKKFYVTEIPYLHGEAFPGLIHLAATTFVNSSDDGFDEFFRAHEVAHQWWGIGVDFDTYHDQWLSEGFASFSGLWYLQTARKQNKQYFGMLDHWKADVMLHRGDREALAFGYRVGDPTSPEDYQTIIYEKGGWVLHMLRILMIDLKTMNEDRFTATMRDFYATYQGRRASTDDFRRVVEKHVGTDMRWFFDEWFNGTQLPSYKVAWKAEPADGGKYRVKLRVAQEHVPADFQMYVPVTIDLGNKAVARLRVKVSGPMTEVDLPLMPSKPEDLHFNDLSGVLADVSTTGWSD